MFGEAQVQHYSRGEQVLPPPSTASNYDESVAYKPEESWCGEPCYIRYKTRAGGREGSGGARGGAQLKEIRFAKRSEVMELQGTGLHKILMRVLGQPRLCVPCLYTNSQDSLSPWCLSNTHSGNQSASMKSVLYRSEESPGLHVSSIT